MRRAFGFVVALVLVVGIVGVIVAGFHAKDRYDREQARPAATAHWQAVKARLAARVVDSRYPLEFGAVWMTHTHRICGLVNGGPAFGDPTGMTPFFLDGDQIRFKVETGQQAFTDGWRECGNDRWLELEKGS